jgi:glycerol-3-phosphate dehydrogenase
MQGFEATLRAAAARYPFLSEGHLRRLLRAYGTRIHGMLAGVGGLADLGAVLGADLTEAELRYLVRCEWVRTANDVLWRRSKLGLRLTKAEVHRVEDALQRIVPAREPVV